MLKSVNDQFDEIQQVLIKQAPQELRRLAAVDKELLAEVLPLLKVN